MSGHAQHCSQFHTNQLLPSGLAAGQNLFMSSWKNVDVVDGIKIWIEEEKDFDMGRLRCKKRWDKCGHFTQVDFDIISFITIPDN